MMFANFMQEPSELKKMKVKDNLQNKKTLIVLGILFIVIGVVCNQWIIAALFSPDGNIGTIRNKIIIFIFNILCISIGFILIKFRYRIKVREIIFSIITFVLFLFLMEGGIRIFYMVKNRIIPRERNFSKYIGWETAANIFTEEIHKGYGEITYSTTKWGFRVFGDIDTYKTKIFIIGDSITQAYTVSDGYAYYDYLEKKNNNIEIFAYGAGGYGSLQEYMILERYFDIIKPDIIVWQFSSNDIINNDHKLESASLINNNHMIRPYYIQDHIEWLYPAQNRGLIYKIVQSSYLLRLLDIGLKILRAQNVDSIEDKLSNDHPLFKESLNTTSDILGLVRKKVGNVPIVAFSADNKKWIGNAFFDICIKYDIHFIPNLPEAIQAAKESGVSIDGSPHNPHWNNNGHSIAGEIILNHLIEKRLLNNE